MSQIKNSPRISTAQRAYLRAQAHSLKPVVMIGDAGLSESVLKEIHTALEAHGLIKIRVLGDDRAARLEMLTTICEKLSCHAIQHIGKLLVIWRESETSTQSFNQPTNLQRNTANRSSTRPLGREDNVLRARHSRTDAYDSLRRAGTKDEVRRNANTDDARFSNSPRERARQHRQEEQALSKNNVARGSGSATRNLGKRSFGDALQQRNPRPGTSRTSASRVHPLLAPASRKKRPVSIKKRSLGS